MTYSIFVASAPGIEGLLGKELVGLGVSGLVVEPGGVAFEGDLATVVKVNLWSGLATHVLLRLGTFAARRFDVFVRKATRLPWASMLSADVPVVVKATCRRSKLYHSGAVEERVLAAIDASFGKRPNGPGEPVSVIARIVEDQCTISIDTSGDPLHRRGWRKQTAKAPLREDLARALLLSAGWTPAEALVDPMMGSGTIVIEAATMALNLAPGRMRGFAFERMAPATEALLGQARRDAESNRREQTARPILGRDHMDGALAAARGNADRAGVSSVLVLEKADVAEPWSVAEPGLLCTNPPFGKRVEHGANLSALHRALGASVSAAGPRWRAALVTDDRRHARDTGLRLVPALTTDHGGLKVDFMVTPRAATPGR